MVKFYICTEAFVVTIYDSEEDEAKALHYGAMPQAELQKLVEEKGVYVPRGEDKWFRAGQRVHESHPVFRGESGRHRRLRLFVPEDDLPEASAVTEQVVAEPIKRRPGRPRKVEVPA